MFDARGAQLQTLAALCALPLAIGCVADWHEDEDSDWRRNRPWWEHNAPMDQECPAGSSWDPVACECLDEAGRTVRECPAGLTWDVSIQDCVTSDGSDPDGGTGGSDPDGGTGGVNNCPSDMSSLYLSRDYAACSTIQFTCPDGYDAFAVESCGCGCSEQSALDPCPDPTQDGVLFVSTEAKVCNTVSFTCPDGQDTFFAECGCGCIDAPAQPVCPNAADPNVHYLGEDPSICSVISFTCPDTCTPFNNECGCGCIENGS